MIRMAVTIIKVGQMKLVGMVLVTKKLLSKVVTGAAKTKIELTTVAGARFRLAYQVKTNANKTVPTNSVMPNWAGEAGSRWLRFPEIAR